MDPQAAENLYKTITEKSDTLQKTVATLNHTSGEYRDSLSGIDDKLIYLLAGSISLLLTFVGIVFNSQRDTTAMNFYFVIAAVVSMLGAIAFLLLSRWLWALYIFSMVHKNYLTALKEKSVSETEMYKSYPNLYKPDLSPYSTDELAELVTKRQDFEAKISKQIEEDENKEKRQGRWAKITGIVGYGVLVGSYALAVLFFMDVIRIMG